MAGNITDAIDRSASLLRARAGSETPHLAVVLGSGLGSVARAIADPISLPYAELPGFPLSRVAGHENRLVLGRLGGLKIICLEGRTH